MGRPIKGSVLEPIFKEIIAEKGSPNLRMRMVILAGGQEYRPLKITRVLIDTSTSNNYADEVFIHVAVPAGDLMSKIAPYQDDLIVEMMVFVVEPSGSESEPEESLTRTYRAFFDDQVKTPIQSSNDPSQTDIEMANRSDIEIVVFRLEELFVEQLSYQTTGVGSIRGAAPLDAAVALIASKAKQIKLDSNSTFKGFTIEPGYNTIARNSITIEDGTPILDLPDIMQNDFGGIYKENVGFYIQREQIYIWPLYKLDRGAKAHRILRVFVSPDPRSSVVDRTWRIPEGSPEILDIWVAGNIHVEDEGLSNMRRHGTSVRTVDPQNLLKGFVEVNNNTVSVNAKDNNIQFKDGDLVNGRNIIRPGKTVSNPFTLASKLAKNHGMKVLVTWNHSLPTLLVPGMAVELTFDFMDELRVVSGTLLDAHTAIDVEGEGMISQRYISTTILTLFVDRNDDIFKAWKKDGAPGASPNPQIG